MSEIRITNTLTGGQKNSKLARFDLIPVGPLTQLAEHFGRGAQKYEDRNWERGVDWSLCYAALMRHVTAWWDGEDLDQETGSSHLVAVAWHAFALLEYAVTRPALDDRPYHPVPEEVECGHEVSEVQDIMKHYIVETGQPVFKPTKEGTKNA